MKKYCLFSFIILVNACAPYPKDPENSYNKIHQKTLLVGAIEAPPWVHKDENGRYQGVEVELVKELAKSMKADVEWIEGSSESLLRSLSHYQIHLVIGGLTQENPWKKRLGFTRPYHESTYFIASKQETVPQTLENLSIGLERTSPYSEKLKGLDLKVDYRKRPQEESKYFIAPDWLIERENYSKSHLDIFTEKSVMATPPGENRWLKKVEEFLESHKEKISTLLRNKTW